MSNLLTRILVAVVAIPLALGIVWYGGLPLAALVIVAAVLATRELFDLAEKTGVRPLRGLGMVLAMAEGDRRKMRRAQREIPQFEE